MTGPVRVLVRDQVKKDNPGWEVEAHPYVPKNVRRGKPAVAVWRSDLQPGSSSLKLRHLVTINLYGSRTAGDEVEEELDGDLDLLLLSLQRLDLFTWTSCVRSTWGQIAGWTITGYLEPNNMYAETIRKEQTNG